MASNFASVKLAAGLVNEARREAELLNRSLGGQIEHWARLGRAIGNGPGFMLDRVRDALEGRPDAPGLSVQEQNSLFEHLGERFSEPSETGAEHVVAVRPPSPGKRQKDSGGPSSGRIS